jgi:DNA polymerase-3 subunit epsilon
MERFAIIDTETTGFGSKDRLVEIAVVIVEGREIILEWETLINPERDISNSSIHGITAELVSLAPTFLEIESDLSRLIHGTVMVAHNLSFDQRMIQQEFNRIKKQVDLGTGFCTLQATKLKLEAACQQYGITNVSAHRALTDARATALIFIKVLEESNISPGDLVPISAIHDVKTKSAQLLSRAAISSDHKPGQQSLRRIIHGLGPLNEAGPDLSYLDALSSVMSDFEITSDEMNYLNDWAQTLGISDKKQAAIHEEFLNLIITAAQKDNYISETERILINKAALTLRVSHDSFQYGVEASNDFKMSSGMKICFTGTAVGNDGKELSRETLEIIAKNAGHIPVSSVTKKTCDLLVAADKSSLSGKAKKARDYGIPVISVSEYLDSIS